MGIICIYKNPSNYAVAAISLENAIDFTTKSHFDIEKDMK